MSQEEQVSLCAVVVKYFGHVIDTNGVHTTPSKQRDTTEARAPSNVTELCSFLGLALRCSCVYLQTPYGIHSFPVYNFATEVILQEILWQHIEETA